MSDLDTLNELRRLEELEARAGGAVTPLSPQQQFTRNVFGAMPGGQYIPDVAFGARQVLDAAAQKAARGFEAMTSPDSTVGQWARSSRADTERVNQEALDAYRQNYGQIPGSEFARAVGQTAATLPITPMLRAATIPRAIVAGGGIGAGASLFNPIYGAGDSADFWGKVKEEAKQGAAIGAATGGLVSAAGRVAAPQVSPAERQLINENISPTLGQSLGGFAKTLEEKIGSTVPILGDAIAWAQRGGIEDFNRALYARALRPLGLAPGKKFPVGNDGIAKVGDTLSEHYDNLLARANPLPVTPNFESQLTTMASALPASRRGDFLDTLNRLLGDRQAPANVAAPWFPTLSPTAAKGIDSELKRLGRQYRGSADADQRELGRAYADAASAFRLAFADQNPAIAAQLRAVDAGWSHLIQIEQAGQMLGAKNGIISPAQYLNAVRAGDSSVRNRRFARDEAQNASFARAADEILSKRYPDSGTAGRWLVGSLATGGAGLASPTGVSAALSTVPYLAAASVPYLPGMRQATAAMLMRRPKGLRSIGGLLQDVAPSLAAPMTYGLLE